MTVTREMRLRTVYCLLGNEGIPPPVKLLEKGRQELRAYDHVALHDELAFLFDAW
jgi:hypothetical protein